MTSQLKALDKFWDSGAPPAGLGGVFSDGANWIPSFRPTAMTSPFWSFNSRVLIPYTVTFPPPDNDRLIIEDDRVTLDLNRHSYETLGPSADLIGNVPGRAGRLPLPDGVVYSTTSSSSAPRRIGSLDHWRQFERT